jgi:hypothetical protein
MDAVRMKTASLGPLGAENAALLTGRCHLRYCGMTLTGLNFGLW